MGFSYDGTNLNDGATYTCRREGSDVFTPPARRHVATPYASTPGGRLALVPPGMRVLRLGGHILGTSDASWESNKDALLKLLSRPKRRLVAGLADSRWTLATPRGVQVQQLGPALGTWSAEFEAEDAYLSAASPSADVRTPTLASTVALPSESGPYAVSYAVTPGGTAPATLRAVIVNQSGGVTPTRWWLRNVTPGLAPFEAVTADASVAAGSVIVIDGDRQYVLTASMANVLGWWPMEDASGTVRDFSGNSRDLTANGAIAYGQDGYLYGAIACGGTSSDYLESASAGLNRTGALTIMAWVKPTVTNVLQGFAGRGGSNLGYWLGANNAGKWAFTTGHTAFAISSTSRSAMTTAEWAFIAGVWDGTTLQSLYVNAELEASTGSASTAMGAAANNFRIGAPHYPGTGSAAPSAACIDEVAVLDVALTQAQLQSIYEDALPAYNGSRKVFTGVIPSLYPYVGSTNTIDLRADHGATAPTPRIALAWRARYE